MLYYIMVLYYVILKLYHIKPGTSLGYELQEHSPSAKFFEPISAASTDLDAKPGVSGLGFRM